MSFSFQLRPVTSPDDVIPLWRKISDDNAATIFHSTDYITCLLQQDRKTDLYLLMGGADKKLLLLGLMGKSGGPIRHFHLGETGDKALDAIYSEYNDFLIAPEARGDAEDLRQQAVQFLLEQKDIDALIARNAMPALTKAMEQAEGRLHIFQDQHCWQMDLPKNPQEEFFIPESVSANSRRQIRRSIEFYKQRGDIRVAQAEDETTRRAYWQELAGLHQAGWQGRGQAGAFANSAFLHFHENLMRDAPEKISLLRISAGNKTIGLLYNYIHGTCVSNYQAGFAYEDDNRLKPGLVAHIYAAGFYAGRDFQTYDLLAGDARYKQSLAIKGTRLRSLELNKKTLRTVARNFVRDLRGK